MNVNDVNAAYFIGTYNGNEFPFSIGSCNPLDILGANGFQQADCVGEDAIEWKYYSDSSCSSLVASITYNSTYQTRSGTLFDFNCDDNSTDSYVEIEYAAFSCGFSPSFSIHTAIGVCTLVEDDEISFQTYCEPNWMQSYFFDSFTNTSDCDENTLYNIANATDTCGFILKTSGIKIYGTVCNYIQIFSFCWWKRNSPRSNLTMCPKIIANSTIDS